MLCVNNICYFDVRRNLVFLFHELKKGKISPNVEMTNAMMKIHNL